MKLAPAIKRRGYELGKSNRRAHGLGLLASVGLATVVVLSGLSQMRAGRMRCCGETKQQIARSTIYKYAFEAYPSWSAANPTHTCPAKLEVLNEWMNHKDIRDPWGTDYRFRCRSLTGVTITVISAGEDQELGTADDIRSDR